MRPSQPPDSRDTFSAATFRRDLQRKGLAACTLLILCGSPAPLFAQAPGTSRTRIPAKEPADELNKLLAAAQDALDRKDYAAAAQSYQDYLAKQPNDAAVHFQLGYTYTAMQRPDEAKAEYEKAIALDPQMQPAYLNLGLTLLQTDPASAVPPLQKAVELAPDQPKPNFLLGTALDRAGKLSEAIEQYQAAEKLDDKDYELRIALGEALLKSARTADAESEFREALALRPESSTAHWGLAQCYEAGKNFQGEADELGAYLKAQPDDTAAHAQRASALLKVGKNDDALAELNQKNAGAQEDVRTLMLRAQIAYELKRYGDTVIALQKAAALDPKNADIPARLGHVYLQLKDYPNAARQLAVSFQMNPQATDVLGELVMAQYLNKNYQATIEGLKLVATREPLPAGSWFVLGACYDKMGMPADALMAYQMFLQLNKDQNNDMYFEATARVRFLIRELRKR